VRPRRKTQSDRASVKTGSGLRLASEASFCVAARLSRELCADLRIGLTLTALGIRFDGRGQILLTLRDRDTDVRVIELALGSTPQ